MDIPGLPVSTASGLMLFRIRGNAAIRPETVLSFEAGYRAVPRKALSVDFALFSSRYRELIGLTTPDSGFVNGHAVATTAFANGFSARTYGGEMTATWDIGHSLRSFASYSRLHTLAQDGAVSARSFEDPVGRTPLNQATFSLAYTPKAPHRLDIDLYCTGKLPGPRIPAHERLDISYEWRIRPGLSISAVGRDLISRPHREYVTTYSREAFVRRSASVTVRWEL
jgi:outer membrane receptor protein involved in Fe transport